MIQRSMEKKRSGERGFTLVELLIVIVILGILAAIVVLAIGGLKDTAQGAACTSGLKTLQSAEDAYFASHDPNTYTDIAGLNGADLLKTDPSADFTITGADATTYHVAANATGKCTGPGTGLPFDGP